MSRRARIRRATRRYSPRRMVRRIRRSKTVPILPLAGLAVGLMPSAKMAIEGNFEGALAEASARYTGYNIQSGQFDAMYAIKNGWLPFIAGCAGHMVANKVGLNRHLKKVPMVGKWVQF